MNSKQSCVYVESEFPFVFPVTVSCLSVVALGIEPSTSEISALDYRLLFFVAAARRSSHSLFLYQSGERGSNPQPQASKAHMLPLAPPPDFLVLRLLIVEQIFRTPHSGFPIWFPIWIGPQKKPGCLFDTGLLNVKSFHSPSVNIAVFAHQWPVLRGGPSGDTSR